MAKMTREEYIRFQEERSKKVQLICNKISAFVPSLFTKSEYPKFLSFLAKWQHYPSLNCILLYMQCPQATYIAGFKRWQELAEQQGYPPSYQIIQDGQKKRGITLFIPFSQKENIHFDRYNTVLVYNTILVFDVSQINKLAIPPDSSLYVDLQSLDVKGLLWILRGRCQMDLAICAKDSSAVEFRYTSAYLKGNQLVYNDGLSDEEAFPAILEQYILYQVKQTGNEKESKYVDLVHRSAVYAIFSYFHLSTEWISFDFISYFQKASSATLLYLIQRISEVVQVVIFEIYEGYQDYVSVFMRPKQNEWLRRLEQTYLSDEEEESLDGFLEEV